MLFHSTHPIFLLVENAARKEVYAVLNTPNFIKTDDRAIIGYMSELADKVLKWAVQLGKKGE